MYFCYAHIYLFNIIYFFPYEFEGGEIKLPTGENFSQLSFVKLTEITDAVNDLITSSLESRHDLNSNVQPEHHTMDNMPVAAGYYVNISSKHILVTDETDSSGDVMIHVPTLDMVDDIPNNEEKNEIMERT